MASYGGGVDPESKAHYSRNVYYSSAQEWMTEVESMINGLNLLGTASGRLGACLFSNGRVIRLEDVSIKFASELNGCDGTQRSPR